MALFPPGILIELGSEAPTGIPTDNIIARSASVQVISDRVITLNLKIEISDVDIYTKDFEIADDLMITKAFFKFSGEPDEGEIELENVDNNFIEPEKPETDKKSVTKESKEEGSNNDNRLRTELTNGLFMLRYRFTGTKIGGADSLRKS